MAYKQAGGVLGDPVKKRVEGGGENETAASVNVKTYDVTSGTEGTRTVKKDSPAYKVSKEFGNEIDFGSSVPQTKPAGESTSNGTNRNTGATKSTYGNLSPNFKGRAKDKNNKIVDFSNNNNDSRRGENYRLY